MAVLFNIVKFFLLPSVIRNSHYKLIPQRLLPRNNLRMPQLLTFLSFYHLSHFFILLFLDQLQNILRLLTMLKQFTFTLFWIWKNKLKITNWLTFWAWKLLNITSLIKPLIFMILFKYLSTFQYLNLLLRNI